MENFNLTLDAAFWITVAAIVALLLMSAFFSGSETALTAASRGKLRSQADRGSRGAARALKITEDNERLIGSVLLGNNIVNILAASLATALFTRLFGDNGVALATLVMTALVQSSSVTTSIVIPLAGAGILTIHQIFPYTLGANVGTTITAMLAALSTGEIIAVAVAFAHLLFNIIGIVLLYPLKRFPIACAQWLARLTMQSRVIPILYIIVLFFVIPLLLIWITG